MKVLVTLITYIVFLIIFQPANAFPAKGMGGNLARVKINSTLDADLFRLINENSNNQVIQTSNRPVNALVTVDAVAKHDGRKLLNDMLSIGLVNAQAAGRFVSGSLPISALESASLLNSLHYLYRSRTMTYNSVISQGVQAMTVDAVQAELGLNGNGIRVGVMSDSYNCYAKSDDMEKLIRSAETDIAGGELPQGVIVLEEAHDCDNKSDEGRALMQIIHDIAPEAELLFFSGANGMANTINGLRRFYDEQVNLIVDDTALRLETYYQDGPINQLIEQLSQNGVIYVTAAGNNARNAYQSIYRNVYDPHLDIHAHDFDPGESVDVFQAFTLAPGNVMQLELQWTDPAYSVSGPPGSATDLDIFIVNDEGTEILETATQINTGRDPSEFIQFANPESSKQSNFNILITKASGPPPKEFKYIIQGRFNGEIIEYTGNRGTITGRSNSAQAITVGAASYDQTPTFGEMSPILQFFSSAGGDTAIWFDSKGKRFAQAIYRQKPDIVAPDNNNTTFFQFDRPEIDYDNDGLPNFLGTSAAAPHAAGLIALLLQVNPDLQPDDIKHILKETAVDMYLRNMKNSGDYQDIVNGHGQDDDSGYGLLDATAAVALAKTYPASTATNNGVDSDINTVVAETGGAGALDWVLTFGLFIFIFRNCHPVSLIHIRNTKTVDPIESLAMS
ncbi:MAG: S8 family serine peptidase [Candidatus Thiodiazotropha sp.]